MLCTMIGGRCSGCGTQLERVMAAPA